MGQSRIEIRELRIAPDLVDAIVRHCAGALPSEGCGLLAGRLTGGMLAAGRFYPGTNVLASPSRFVMDPTEVVAALSAIDREGARLAAIVHSHPATAPNPSRTDLREAFYPEALLLILSFAEREPRLRAWRLVPAADDEPHVVEVPIRVGTPR